MSKLSINLTKPQRSAAEKIAVKRGFRTANDWLYNIIIRAVADDDTQRRAAVLIPATTFAPNLAPSTTKPEINESVPS